MKNKKKLSKTKRRTQSQAEPPGRDDDTCQILRFTPYAWAKLQWFCHHGDTEIGGFGITPQDDLLLIQDFAIVQQQVTCVSVVFDDEAVADFFEQQVDASRRPEQFARIWLHSHPGDSPTPSGTDEETFSSVFGKCDWAVMFIAAKGGKTYARLRFNVGPKGETCIPVQVDFSRPFPASEHENWLAEYVENIQSVPLAFGIADHGKIVEPGWDEAWLQETDPLHEQSSVPNLDDTDSFEEVFDEQEYWL